MEANKKGKCKAEIDAIDEDKKFLLKMQTDRSASFASKDTVTTKLKTRRLARKERESKRGKKILGKMKDSYMYEEVNPEIDLDQDPFTIQNPDTSVKRRHRRIVKTSCQITIPHDILKDPDIVSLYTRHNVSHSFMSAMMFTIIKKCGGDPNAISLSASSTLR